MNGKKANLCVTDPPYACGYVGSTGLSIMNDTLMALDTSALPVEEDEDTLNFPWLAGTAPSELIEACAQLTAALIKLAKKQKRVTLVAGRTDNPRYALRCFPLQLGFIGDNYKKARGC
ncbi:hypothetical protein LJC74_05065 [Eubacteriales bacterium OttesenSCG-928-A19]|nr:hypothetical protein [Eubacteriales bacterium OttesenSCG-928-A19]